MSTAVAAQILQMLGPSCRSAGRRSALLSQAVLNGIDFVEFEEVAGAPPQHLLHVHFLNAVPAGAFGLPANLAAVRIVGGTRIVGISVTKVTVGAGPMVLDVEVNAQGDFSPYLLAVGWTDEGEPADAGDSPSPGFPGPQWIFEFPGIDRLFSVAPINFRPGCPVDFDCAPVTDCPPGHLDEPALDYLAKDYASFRQMLLDLVAQWNPNWVERSPADVGMALLELFAYEGDQLSYFQDAVANEAFLDTSRQRVSAKRHAKLVDYQMHDGRNAWTYAHLQVATSGAIPTGQQLVTKIRAPMRFDRKPTGTVQPTAAPGTLLNTVTDEDYRTDPALAQVRVFETASAAQFDVLNNELRLHTWGNDQCCHPVGTTTAHVYAIDPGGSKAVRPPLAEGDFLLLEEVLGPETSAAADADPAHRQVVRITDVSPEPSTTTTGVVADRLHDPLYLAALDPLTKQPLPVTVPVPIADTLPLVQVTWGADDALAFPLCLSARHGSTDIHQVSVARGNIVAADHGRSVEGEHYEFDPPLAGDARFRLRLAQGPLTMSCPAAGATGLGCEVRSARPAVSVMAQRLGIVTATWVAVPDLLSSSEFEHHFVADIDNQGRAVLRFGDGQYGAALVDVDRVDVAYRVGNGNAGNIGADSLAHLVVPPLAPGWPVVERLRNPLAARAGVDPELIEEVRQHAPAAFRARQFRAVTEQDYMDAALTISGVKSAVASFRWTGSWYTVFVGIEPTDPGNMLTDPRGHTQLGPEFRTHVHDSLSRFRLAGYDLEIRSARAVPLDVTIHLCVRPGYFRGDVAHAVSVALTARAGPATRPGLFSPGSFTFGQTVYLSRVYSVVEDVEGVESATVTAFHRHGRDPAGELESGSIPIGPWEVARLDNNRSNMENGTLAITAGGGS